VWFPSGHVIVNVVRIAYDFTLGISRLCIASLVSITKMGRGFNRDVYWLYKIISDSRLKARSCPICKNCGSKKFSILSRSEKEIVLQCLACRRLSSI
jgi:hypothetical protein